MEWRPLKGYEGFYKISERGDIESLITGFIRKPGLEDGHLKIQLLRNGRRKNHRIHKLVYETFVGEVPDGYDVHHLDENKLHNHFSNLGLMLISDHRSFHSAGEKNARAKLSNEQVDIIRSRAKKENLSSIAKDYNVSYHLIWRIVTYQRR